MKDKDNGGATKRILDYLEKQRVKEEKRQRRESFEKILKDIMRPEQLLGLFLIIIGLILHFKNSQANFNGIAAISLISIGVGLILGGDILKDFYLSRDFSALFFIIPGVILFLVPVILGNILNINPSENNFYNIAGISLISIGIGLIIGKKIGKSNRI